MAQNDSSTARDATNPLGGIGETAGELPLPIGSAVKPLLTRSYEAFLNDLPALMASHPGQWAAYAGDVRLGTGASKRALYRQCIAAGHRDGDFLICGIESPQTVVLDDLLDV